MDHPRAAGDRERGRADPDHHHDPGWLEARDRVIVVVLGVVFGVWFLIKGLTNLGVL